MRTRTDAESNDRAVLRAVIDLHGETPSTSAVSVDAVAVRAGVGKGTVFRAYGDKAGLLRAAMAACAEPTLQRLDERDGGRPEEQLVAVVEALLDLKVAHRHLAVALEELGAGSPFAALHYEQWFERIRAHAVALGVAEPDFTAHLVLGAVRSDLVEHLLGAQGWRVEELRAAVRGTTLRLVGRSST